MLRHRDTKMDVINMEAQGSLCGNRVSKHVLIDVLKILFHTISIMHHWFVTIDGGFILIPNFQNPIEELRVLAQYTLAYGTNWNFMFQTVFLSLSLLYDVLQWLDKHETNIGKKLAYFRDITFSGLVVPFTLFISSMFWTVYHIDRELVFPEVYDQIVPWWFNHCVHTNITIVVLVETILQARRYPRSLKVELALVTLVNVLYAIVYYTIYFLTHRWLYGVFGVMTWWQVCLYQLLIWASAFIFYFLQFPINRIFHHEQDDEQKIPPEPKSHIEGADGDASFPAKTWSLKYRSIKNENSKL